MLCTQIVSILIVFLSYVAQDGYAKRIPRWWMKVAQRQGPNACVVEEIPDTDLEIWTECRFWLKRKICGKKTRIRFECCEGFDHLGDENGCTLVKPLQNILDTAEALGATKWVRYIKEAGLEDELTSDGVYTLFAPTNTAFDSMKMSMKQKVEGYRGRVSNPIIRYHLLPSKVELNALSGDHNLETWLDGHSIRINKYSNGMTTANCALLTRRDQEATNGMVHIIDGVLNPENGAPKEIVEIIQEDGRFEIMSELLYRSGFARTLKLMPKSMTILVPSDEAFQKLPDSRREKIMQDSKTTLAILKNHVIPHVICESAITGEHKVRTELGTKLIFDCSSDGTTVEDTRMTNSFLLGQNGILHIINEVFLPDRAKTLVELAESRGLATFVDLIRRSGLEESLSNTGDYTFFVPEETAWFEIVPEVMVRARRDPEYAGELLRFHGIYGRLLTSGIENKQKIASLDEDNILRFQVWRKAISVEDAKVVEPDIESYNGVLHIINKVMIPSKETVWKALDNTSEQQTFKSFQAFLSRAQSAGALNLNFGKDNHYTYFVPTDRALKEYDQSEFARLRTGYTRNLVMNHIVPSLISEAVLEPGLTYSIKGFGQNLNIKKNNDGSLEVNGAKVLGTRLTTNGIIYLIEKVLKSSNKNTFTYHQSTTTSVTSHDNIPLPHKIYPSRNKIDSNYDVRSTINERLVTVFPSLHSQEKKNFSYVGHYYGNDAIGPPNEPRFYSMPSYRRSDLIQSSARPIDLTLLNGRINSQRQSHPRIKNMKYSKMVQKYRIQN